MSATRVSTTQVSVTRVSVTRVSGTQVPANRVLSTRVSSTRVSATRVYATQVSETQESAAQGSVIWVSATQGYSRMREDQTTYSSLFCIRTSIGQRDIQTGSARKQKRETNKEKNFLSSRYAYTYGPCAGSILPAVEPREA